METYETKSSMSEEEKKQMAEKLYAKAKQLLGTDIERAEKYLSKAERFYSTPHAMKLLKEVQRSRSEARNYGPASNRANTGQNSSTQAPRVQGRRRRLPTERVADQNYTLEQIEAVRRISRCQTYYEIFQVSSEATTDEIRASYRKLSLVLHPDKNQAPGSTQAFQIITNAADILSDHKKREEYDKQLEREREIEREREREIERERKRMEPAALLENVAFKPTSGLLIVGGIALGLGLLGLWWKSRQQPEEGQAKGEKKPVRNP